MATSSRSRKIENQKVIYHIYNSRKTDKTHRSLKKIKTYHLSSIKVHITLTFFENVSSQNIISTQKKSWKVLSCGSLVFKESRFNRANYLMFISEMFDYTNFGLVLFTVRIYSIVIIVLG